MSLFRAVRVSIVLFTLLCVIDSLSVISAQSRPKFKAEWNSLDSRPLPTWYDEAKVGIFLHWGVYSVPSFGSEWFWHTWKARKVPEFQRFINKSYHQNFKYQEFAADFTAELFNATDLAKMLENSGAKYVVLTSKHHEGFNLWPSTYSFGWNAGDIGPRLDLLGDLAAAVRKHTNMRFGAYYSLYEWFNPMYLADQKSNYSTKLLPMNKVIPELKELVNNYQPEIVWSDGDWEASDEYWSSKEFLAWLYNESPVRDTVVTNDRWGQGIPCKHGGFFTCQDRYNPGTLQPHKWENAMTIDQKSWGFRRNAAIEDYLTITDLVHTLVQTVSCGGNILINVGPCKDGTIAAIYQERLAELGKWLKTNGQAIYSSRPWIQQNDTKTPGIWYTSNAGVLYTFVMNWPKQDQVILHSAVSVFDDYTTVHLLNEAGDISLKWKKQDDTIIVDFPNKANVGGDWTWVLKIKHT